MYRDCVRVLHSSGPLMGRGGASTVSEKGVDAAAGRPSGRRPFITTGGMGASAPIITSNDFYKALFSKST